MQTQAFRLSTWCEIVKPEQCVFVIGVPSTTSDFWNVRLGLVLSDYFRVRTMEWQTYRDQFADRLGERAAEMSRIGVRVIRSARPERLRQVLASANVRVCVVLSHALCDDGIELGGFLSVRQFVNCIPPTFNGVLDLGVCNSPRLAEAVMRERPCLVARFEREVQPRELVDYYLLVFARLHESSTSYSAAANWVEAQLRGHAGAIAEK